MKCIDHVNEFPGLPRIPQRHVNIRFRNFIHKFILYARTFALVEVIPNHVYPITPIYLPLVEKITETDLEYIQLKTNYKNVSRDLLFYARRFEVESKHHIQSKRLITTLSCIRLVHFVYHESSVQHICYSIGALLCFLDYKTQLEKIRVNHN